MTAKKLTHDNALEHYGIRGMRWGIRRRNPSGKEHKDSSSISSLRGKKVNQLSNDELKRLNQRLQLEQTYKNLSAKDISSGKKFVGDILLNAGKNVAAEYVASGLKYGATTLGKAVMKV